ncbi:hypothetical protein D2E26_1309 [Bifidobacterium dolichotidis]|uniref:CTP synthase n=2 Tax=Bifidobacterium dolichotidis TaxID=2306976 RepID=A0A430FNW0_9BIFI|nr:hypothetical protein D2E26_1309 [Bifidobacterium dolichotidis]
MARGISQVRPHLVFTSQTAAILHGFELSYQAIDGKLHVATEAPVRHAFPGLCFERTPEITPQIIDGMQVVPAAHTATFCCLTLPFRYALQVIDSALRSGVSPESIAQSCNAWKRDCSRVTKMLMLADPNSENGGESLFRALLLELGFARPLTQVVLIGPTSGQIYRVDFLYITPNGKLVIIEFNGMAKYSDTSMLNGQSLQQKVGAQMLREEDLKAMGATVINASWNTLRKPQALKSTLLEAGVPLSRTPLSWLRTGFDLEQARKTDYSIAAQANISGNSFAA